MNIKGYDFYYKLRKLPYVEEIWLFGSRAKGLERERSDVELAIICPEATQDDWRPVVSIVESADTLLKIDCIRFDQLQENGLKGQILQNKKVLFKRVKNNHIWYELFLDLGEALYKFNDALNYDRNKFPRAVEATIQTFEYTFELYMSDTYQQLRKKFNL